MTREFTFQPSKTYKTEANARLAAEKLTKALEENGASARYMVVGVPATMEREPESSPRYALVFFNVSDESMYPLIAHHGHTVVN